MIMYSSVVVSGLHICTPEVSSRAPELHTGPFPAGGRREGGGERRGEEGGEGGRRGEEGGGKLECGTPNLQLRQLAIVLVAKASQRILAQASPSPAISFTLLPINRFESGWAVVFPWVPPCLK